jgi:hypothetical protein
MLVVTFPVGHQPSALRAVAHSGGGAIGWRWRAQSLLSSPLTFVGARCRPALFFTSSLESRIGHITPRGVAHGSLGMCWVVRAVIGMG